MTDKKRDSVRIDTSFELGFSLLNDSRFNEVKNRIMSSPTSEKGGGDLPLFTGDGEALPELEPAVLVMWEMMNRKLDYIISLLKEGSEEALSEDHRGICVNMSGNGIKMICAEPLRNGQLIEAHLRPPAFLPFLLKIIGRVIRDKGADSSPDGKTEFGVEFEVINEVDRELLIKYIFKRQREILRS